LSTTGVPTKYEYVDVADKEVRISNPDKVFFPLSGLTKRDLVDYYVAVGAGALRGCQDRPIIMYRWPNGVDRPEDAFYQKRVLDRGRPEWLETIRVTFPSGRSADMLAGRDLAHMLWAINMGCLDLNPWPVRGDDVDHPDELRVDLDPTPEIPWSDVRETAMLVKETLEDFSLVGYPKTSGKRGLHVYIRIERRWTFTEVRRAALALAREVERRGQGIATTAWWKEERVGVFVDYNQNARDRTIASAYSVRPMPDARVSCPLAWEEVPGVEPERYTMRTVPERFASGDPSATIDDVSHSLEPLLDLARRDEEGGLGDAPWPPHFPKAQGEPARVQPSKRKKA
jgi:bifunctional non-homologous end joining protein LigD